MKFFKGRTRRSVLTGAMSAAMLMTSGIGLAAAEEVVLRYNQWFPSGHWSQAKGLYPWFDEIEKVTEGRVKVEPSAKPMAPPNRNFQAVAHGVVDVAWGVHGYTPGVFPLTEMVELPFITQDAGKSSKAYWRLWKEHFEPSGMQNEVVTLAMHVTTGGNIHMREEAITSLEELKGKKLRVPTPVVGRVLSQIGAVPISGSLGELREMLSRGIVDGTVISDELVIGFKLDSDVNAITRVPGGLFANSATVILNKAKWEQISTEDQQAILAISGEALSEKMGSLWQEFDVKAREAFKERLGGNYQEASDAFIAELSEAFSKEQENWKKVATDLGVDADAAIDFYNAQISGLSE